MLNYDEICRVDLPEGISGIWKIEKFKFPENDSNQGNSGTVLLYSMTGRPIGFLISFYKFMSMFYHYYPRGGRSAKLFHHPPAFGLNIYFNYINISQSALTRLSPASIIKPQMN
jgi:hypothetical protein